MTRLARTLEPKDIEQRIARALERRYGLGAAANLAITFDRELGVLQLDATNTGELRAASTRYDARNSRFDVMFEIVNSESATPTRLRFTGTAVETVEAAVLTRAIEANEVLRSSDVVTERRPKAEVGNDPAARDHAVGMQARRALRAGMALRSADLGNPDLVQRDQAVTLIYDNDGIYLTVRAKALEAGTAGDQVSVLNPQSKRTVQGVVTGPGQVSVLNPSPRADHHRRRHPRHRKPTATVKVRVMSKYTFRKFSRLATTGSLLALSGLAGGCSAIDRLASIGEQPKLASIDNPTTKPGYKPVQMPMPTPQPASYNPNSLWRTGSRAFFKDQRAAQIGDILTVTVNINDTANWANETQRSRTDSDRFQHHQLPRRGAARRQLRPRRCPVRSWPPTGRRRPTARGRSQRQEALQTNIAAIVTQILPNGNLVVEGKQDIRVNFEMRELIVAGIVRPEDIQSDNTIDSSKIAEARISMAGRGQIMDIQQPRYGTQVSDILLPF